MSEKMIVKFKPDGSVELETVGFKGKACMDFAKPFKQALGEVVSEKKKPEYYQTETAGRILKRGW